MKMNVTRIVTAGLVGTLAMTAVGLYGAPMMGMPPMNPATMLAAQMGGMVAAGWMAHLMIGVVLAVGYGLSARFLPGPAVVRGATYAIAPWLMAQLIVMPMMGMGLFSGSMQLAGGSLLGHLVYGAVVGGIVGDAAA